MDVEKTMQFILDTQAKTEAILQSMAERQDRADARMDKAEARMEQFDRRMHAYVRLGAKQMARMRETLDRCEAVLERQGIRMDELTEKLDALIVVVDGIVKRPGIPPVA